MPANVSQAKVWYYQDFLSYARDLHILTDHPEDWERLQVWDGSALRPAIPGGVNGIPTDEQIEQLYTFVKEERLFLFELGNPSPRHWKVDGNTFIQTNPEKPQAPKEPGDDASQDELSEYTGALYRYNKQTKIYEKSIEALAKLGAGFGGAVDKFNESRDLERENTLLEGRNLNAIPKEQQRNHDKAEYVISTMMAPRPQVVHGLFYAPDTYDPDESTFKYEDFDKLLEPNGYDLPEDSKLDAYDAATINFAMLGAKTHMSQYIRENMPQVGGPNYIKLAATDGYDMLLTGMFGYSRNKLTMTHCLGEAMRLGKSVIEQYQSGDVEPLGRHLADSVRNLKNLINSQTQSEVSNNLVAAAPQVERLLKLFEKKPDILQATGLQEQEMTFLHGYVQMGKIFENYLNGRIKLNDAVSLHTPLSTEEKAEILADAVIRRMVERDMEKDKQAFLGSSMFQDALKEALKKDQQTKKQVDKWKKQQGITEFTEGERVDEISKYERDHDINTNQALLNRIPVDHKIIEMLAVPGVLDRMRQALKNDPAILEMAQQEKPELFNDALYRGKKLDEMVNRLSPVMEKSIYTEDMKRNWFISMRSMLTGGKVNQDPNAVSPWLNAKAAGDAGRLMIVQTNGDGTKSLVPVASLLANGLNDLQNPSPEALDILHQHANRGNLYYYDVGKDMPLRLNASGEKASYEQLSVPKKPGFWKTVAHFLTGGRAFADEFNVKPDRDPVAVGLFLSAREARSAVAANEDALRRQSVSAAKTLHMASGEKTFAEREAKAVERSQNRADISKHYDVSNSFARLPEEGVKRAFPEYDTRDVFEKVDKVTVANATVNTLYGREMYALNRKMSNVVIGNEAVTGEEICRMMAKAVLLEQIRQENALKNEAGPGLTEQSLAADSDGIVKKVMENQIFRTLTKDASLDMLKHFVMVDGARGMLKLMQQDAKARDTQANAAEAPEQNKEKEIENQALGLN